MIDISSIDGREKVALVSLYFAQLHSDDERYKDSKCRNALTAVAHRYGYKYSMARFDKDSFDALYENGRKGWVNKPLEKRSSYLYNIYNKYKKLSLEEIEEFALAIIEEANKIGKPYFSLKTKDSTTVKSILNKEKNIEFIGINVLQDNLKRNQIVFIVLGGDRPSWNTGLIGMGVISQEPYDLGYDLKNKKNYKIKVDIKLLLDKAIKREDLVPYKDTYGTIGIAPIVKWEQNQALSQMPEKNAIALMRAMLELSPSIEADLEELIDSDTMIQIKGSAKKFIEIEAAYGESLKDSITSSVQIILDEIDEKDKADGVSTVTENVEEFIDLVYKTNYASKFERNRIIFGAPGTGKSYQLKADCLELIEGNEGIYERVTFYQDYSYAQFVGTYKPISDKEGNILYRFVPGPFMRVLVSALKMGRRENVKPCLLLIEEINRAKVASVFGDVFQLLDRDADGVSEYDIQVSEDIKLFLAEQLGGKAENYSKLKLPDNLFIWATMNSADQGVYPLDTAFKRRWNFEYLGIDHNDENAIGLIELKVGEKEQLVNWNLLRKAINEKLSQDCKVNEDKLIGPFFLSSKVLNVDESGIIINKQEFLDTFKSKVLMYLYEDAAKQYRGKLFEGCGSNNRYSSVCTDFDKIGLEIFGKNFWSIYLQQEV